MADKKIFVGRKDELEKFGKVLEDPKGQAVLVVGQVGMGKTWLVNEMAEIAENHPKIRCWGVRYEVTDVDEVNSIAADIMDDAFSAIEYVRNKVGFIKGNQEKWKALFAAGGLIPVVGGKVKAAGELIHAAFLRDIKVETRRQFIKALGILSEKLKGKKRLVFFIDPEKYMKKGTDAVWGIIIKNLPDRVKLVFAQRKEDILVDSEVIKGIDRIEYIPKRELDVLSEEDVNDLLKERGKELPYPVSQVRNALGRYKGHPYAIGAALNLLAAGVKLEELPEKAEPMEFAKTQWEKITQIKNGAIELFEAYAVLEVGVPDEVVDAVSGLKATQRKGLLGEKFLRAMVREEREGKKIYHAILADYIVGQIGEGESKGYHGRAVKVYSEKLAEAKKTQTKPDALAVMRLAEHVLEAEGKEAFVDAFVNECFGPLLNLGLLDAAIALSERALSVVEKGSKEEAAVRCTLGLVYRTKGDLNTAEKMHLRALEIEKEGQREQGMAREYGDLGLIYQTRGDLDKAEEMHKKSLEISEKLELQEVMASAYGNLGLIYYTRGDLDKAEGMHKKALEIMKKIGNQEGIASVYGNLGVVYKTRGDLDKAEEMHKKALEIMKKIGNQEGVASTYGNLGLIYRTRGDLDKAEEMHKKSLEIEEELGRLEGMAQDYGNLGLIYMDRGDLDKAEEMFSEGLKIDEKLGRLEGMAAKYSNLGVVYEERGDIAKAREYWGKAVELYKKIGMPHKVEQVEKWIEEFKG